MKTTGQTLSGKCHELWDKYANGNDSFREVDRVQTDDEDKKVRGKDLKLSVLLPDIVILPL